MSSCLSCSLGYPKIETIPVQVYQFVGGYYLHPSKRQLSGFSCSSQRWC